MGGLRPISAPISMTGQRRSPSGRAHEAARQALRDCAAPIGHTRKSIQSALMYSLRYGLTDGTWSR